MSVTPCLGSRPNFAKSNQKQRNSCHWLEKPSCFYKQRLAGFAPQGGPLNFMKHLLLAPSSAAMASSTFSHRRLAWSLLLQAAIPGLWLSRLCSSYFSFSLFVVNSQLPESRRKCQLNSIIFKPKIQQLTLVEYFKHDRNLNVSLHY